MYRIKVPSDHGYVPILANPDIVDEYSAFVVDTLHKKNLLLLGFLINWRRGSVFVDVVASNVS